MASTNDHPILVLGGTGTVGSRVVQQLRAAGVASRPAARGTEPPFDWGEPGTWDAALDGVHRLYLLLPDDGELPDAFLEQAASAGVRRVVLHSDRGIDVMSVERLQRAEAAVRGSGLEWAILRPDWFDQNFETFLRDDVRAGRVALPVGDGRQGFVDAEDIAAVAVRALTTDDHIGEVLELTGPEAISFGEAAAAIGRATGRTVTYVGEPGAYREAMAGAGLPEPVVDGIVAQFAPLRAAGDTTPTGTVERVLGRPARPFEVYAEEAARRGVWSEPAR
ncbi:NAD(P)H-binding protein [Georgenia sp. Z1344]|uniref:NAD(P)H-binding protein n=1 Tax=Georgenia sp. Z1344 TaxID=3416706 RepID=UPI003CF1F7C1